MKPKNLVLASALAAILLASSASAQWIGELRYAVYALGWFMLIVLGFKWAVADSDGERADAKKGLIYIVIGILIARISCSLMCLYCTAATQSLAAGGLVFTCDMASIFCPGCP
jgi:hypothetical protein